MLWKIRCYFTRGGRFASAPEAAGRCLKLEAISHHLTTLPNVTLPLRLRPRSKGFPCSNMFQNELVSAYWKSRIYVEKTCKSTGWIKDSKQAVWTNCRTARFYSLKRNHTARRFWYQHKACNGSKAGDRAFEHIPKHQPWPSSGGTAHPVALQAVLSRPGHFVVQLDRSCWRLSNFF